MHYSHGPMIYFVYFLENEQFLILQDNQHKEHWYYKTFSANQIDMTSILFEKKKKHITVFKLFN